MAAPQNLGPIDWGLVRDDGWGVAYSITFKVRVSQGGLDGPSVAMMADGLPGPGDLWSIGNELDLRAICRPGVKVTCLDPPDATTFSLEYVFSDKALPNCQPGLIEDPLLFPPVITINSQQTSISAAIDRFGEAIVNSAHEPIKGPQVEFASSVTAITVKQNFAEFDHSLDVILDCVNSTEFWGWPPRTLRISRANQECRCTADGSHHVERTMEFLGNPRTWDRVVLDEGSKIKRGHWEVSTGRPPVWVLDGNPESSNPLDFVRAFDSRGNPWHVVLDGRGNPADVLVFAGGLWISLQPGNLDNSINDAAFWLPLEGDPAGTDFVIGRAYKKGEVVRYLGLYFIVIVDVPAGAALDPLVQVAFFQELLITGPSGPYETGEYDATTTYGAGAIVFGGPDTRRPGTVAIEYYNEADFLLLNLPSELDCASQ